MRDVIYYMEQLVKAYKSGMLREGNMVLTKKLIEVELLSDGFRQVGKVSLDPQWFPLPEVPKKEDE